MSTATVDPVLAALLARHQTLATAESLTGGLLGAMLTAAPGASQVYRGGIISYSTDLKASLVGVPADHLAAHGAVHPDTARLMAQQIRHRCGADWGLATTGVAGPDRLEGHPVGTVWVAAAGPESTAVRQLALSGSRKRIRADAARAVLALAQEMLGAVSPPADS